MVLSAGLMNASWKKVILLGVKHFQMLISQMYLKFSDFSCVAQLRGRKHDVLIFDFSNTEAEAAVLTLYKS